MAMLAAPSSSHPRFAERGPFYVGCTLARAYRIDRVLGQGGMGFVYEGCDLALPRRVAIKVPRSASFAKALRNEGQALAAIRHPSFATVYFLGKQSGIDFLVMERIFGDTLEDWLARVTAGGGRVPVAGAIDLLLTMAEALAAAHDAGVAHRDLKPSNVILAAGRRIVLIDLGLFVPEVLVEPDALPAGSITTMAPEVIRGTVARGNGPLIDLYALGVIAFEILTGRPPFQHEIAQRVLEKHVSEIPPRVSAVRADIPPALATLVAELLAKNPRERPPSAHDVAWRMRSLQASQRSAARKLPPAPA